MTLIPEASHIRPNIHFYDKAEMNEGILILRQLKCLVLQNGIVPLKIHQDQGDKLRGSYGMDNKQKYFAHYICVYLWDSWQYKNPISFDRTEQVVG